MTTPASRRNGKPASCEPCRRGKIRCDHERPVCGRCQYRGLTAKCFYHPAPLTKPRGVGSPRPMITASPVTPLNNSGLQGAYSSVTNHDEAIQYALRAGNESDVRRSQFQDSEVNLRRQVDEILEVFEPLRFLEDIQGLIQGYTSTAAVGLVPAPIMLYATSTLFEISQRVSLPQQNSNIGAPREFATTVLHNSTSAAVVHSDLEYQAFVDMFTGENLRVEMLGLIYTVAARSRVYRLPRSGEQNDRMLYQLFKAGQSCLNLARELAPTVNDVMIWLGFEITRLYTNAQGDSHPNVWRAMGDTISDAFIRELHREAKVAANTPFWLAECRRKNWAVIYHWDKIVATYFQRPPRIAKRYSDCELPLDLTDNELLGSPDTLSEARNRLTSDGWNPAGAYCSTTWYRMRFMASVLLEDQWEYKDQKNLHENTSKLKELAERCQTVRSSLPGCLQYHPGMWNSDMTPSACLMLAILYLFYLHNDLQIHSLLMRIDPAYTGTTLKIANQIVSSVNQFGQVRERDIFLQHDNAYVLLCYGLPAASILIPALSESRSLPEDISRSKLIRELSVFISYLESICTKRDPNYTVCTQAAHVFSRALDAILDPKSVSQVPPVPDINVASSSRVGAFAPLSSTPVAADSMPSDLDLTTTDGLDGFNLDSWMQSVDWTSIGGQYTF